MSGSATERVAPAGDLVAAYLRLKHEAEQREVEAALLAREFKGWQPESEKLPLLHAEARRDEAAREAAHAAAQTTIALHQAVIENPGDANARASLADYYWAEFLDAEARGDIAAQRYNAELVAAYHEGRYLRELAGDGTLELSSSPPGAEVWIHPYVQQGFSLRAGEERLLGKTPLPTVTVEQGSYLVILRKEGFRDTAYPVFISRNRDWKGEVRLLRDGEIGKDFVYVPAGPFVLGGDPETRGWGFPRSEPELDGFLIGRYPVTLGEYLEFLNAIAASDPAEALARAPRLYPERGSYLVQNDDGSLELPPPSEGRQPWTPRFPVFGVSWLDAVSFCDWRSETDGVDYRLPTEFEWEKAARGVDGRWHPWGNRFDPCMCNMRDSLQTGPGPVSVDAFPDDISPYGVRGMGGNVRDWTSSTVAEEGMVPELGYKRWREAWETRVVRGGAWSPLMPRVTDRYWLAPNMVFSFIGFRLARDLPG